MLIMLYTTLIFSKQSIVPVHVVTRFSVTQVSAVGVTGARSNVNLRVEHLLHEIKQVCKL